MKKQLLFSLLVIGNLSATSEIPSFTHIRETSSYGYGKSDATFYAFRNYLISNPDMQLENIKPIIISWFKDNPELYEYTNGIHEQDSIFLERANDTYQPIGLMCYTPDQAKKHQKDFDEYLGSSAYLEDEQLFKTKRSLEIQLKNYLEKVTYVDSFLIMAQACNKYSSEPLPSYLKSAKEQQQWLADSKSLQAECSRCCEVVRVLQKLGIPQTVSDERIDLLADLGIAYLHFLEGNQDSYSFRQMQQGSMQEEVLILKKLLATYES